MDQFDRAQEFEERDRRQALALHACRRRRGPSALVCRECGEPIPEARRLAVPGCVHCVHCAEQLERTGGARD
jgi:phage/conjugal plasmid C-4 type zinc finger TraR family protein